MARHIIAAARTWYTGVRLASVESKLRQDTTNQLLRRSAVALHSKQAESSPELEEESLHKAQQHLEVLLDECRDVVFLHSVLTGALGPKNFYKLPKTVAKCMRRIGLDQICMEEFESKSCFEERATMYHMANALMILKAAGEKEMAKDLFEEACNLKWQDSTPISWTTFKQTPAVHISGLAHRPFWSEDLRPSTADKLEALWEHVRKDLDELLQVSRRDAGGVPAYPALVAGDGDWDMLQLYMNKQWDEAAMRLLPRSGPHLRGLLPSADLPYIHYNTEEVVLFRLTPRSKVQLHNGGSNVPINMSLGLRGCEGSWVEVAGEAKPFVEKKVVCFDDGSDHRVWHDGEEDRWVLTVRQMHPDLVKEPARYFQKAFTR
eukprot:CAMPEP_0178374672 /NCGR_PEP_ID=MMETSP0689_2-20121128/2496_1 /TAXON_ID=160604 /ORGANISM="Amphidinium massartii, Strain CS-259" /LENGTH=375 /DNA_ID=CAMNT_0019994647 /DNA_START=31 /DNA_END=1155 /DNA_ORIENTATION=-